MPRYWELDETGKWQACHPPEKSEPNTVLVGLVVVAGAATALWFGWAIYQWLSSGGVVLIRIP